jgi:hypothetical protein
MITKSEATWANGKTGAWRFIFNILPLYYAQRIAHTVKVIRCCSRIVSEQAQQHQAWAQVMDDTCWQAFKHARTLHPRIDVSALRIRNWNNIWVDVYSV